MKSAENIEKLIKNLDLDIDINTEKDRVILGELIEAHEKSKKMKSALVEPKIRRTIMKNPITKLAVAAAVIAVVGLGILAFIGTGITSGVVWAEVAKKVEASRGVIFRSRDAASWRDSGPDYNMNYLSFTHSRFDSYKGGQIVKTIYNDFDTKTLVLIDHGHKSYIKRTLERMEQNGLWRDPKSLVQRFLSHEHRELGQKTVEGMLCEGIETTDPAFDETNSNSNFTVDSLMARLWVSVETGYPVLLEFEVTRTAGDNEKLHITSIADQLQWDVELDESIFEPNIPADYMRIPMP